MARAWFHLGLNSLRFTSVCAVKLGSLSTSPRGLMVGSPRTIRHSTNGSQPGSNRPRSGKIPPRRPSSTSHVKTIFCCCLRGRLVSPANGGEFSIWSWKPPKLAWILANVPPIKLFWASSSAVPSTLSLSVVTVAEFCTGPSCNFTGGLALALEAAIPACPGASPRLRPSSLTAGRGIAKGRAGLLFGRAPASWRCGSKAWSFCCGL
mmetsp:Transcript_154311/g.287737  ORF Transcript_154311/g.287737 Transcript_154311/m.287737 type:complete len:207 (-) Transcript_154311:886-1506(-)